MTKDIMHALRGVYAIKDQDMGFIEIISFNNDQIAIRKFKELAVSGNAGDLTKYPEKFSLWKIGEYDDWSGEVFPNLKKLCDAPKDKETKETTNTEKEEKAE